MGNVSVEVIADVKSTATVEFPVSNLKSFSSITTRWKTNEKEFTIPASC